MNSKIVIVGIIIAIIIGVVFALTGTNSINSDFKEISSEIVEPVEDIESQQTEGKHVTIELSDGVTLQGP